MLSAFPITNGMNPLEKGKNQKLPRNKGKGKRGSKIPGFGGGRGFWLNILSTLFIFLILISIFSFITENQDKPEEIAVSQLAREIIDGSVASIIVEGEKLEITYIDETEKNFSERSGYRAL